MKRRFESIRRRSVSLLGLLVRQRDFFAESVAPTIENDAFAIVNATFGFRTRHLGWNRRARARRASSSKLSDVFAIFSAKFGAKVTGLVSRTPLWARKRRSGFGSGDLGSRTALSVCQSPTSLFPVVNQHSGYRVSMTICRTRMLAVSQRPRAAAMTVFVVNWTPYTDPRSRGRTTGRGSRPARRRSTRR